MPEEWRTGTNQMVTDASSILGADVVFDSSISVGAFCVLGVDGPAPPLTVGADSTIRSHSVLYRGTSIGRHFHAGHGVLIREFCSIGSGVSIGSHSILEHNVTVEDDVRVHSGCFVPEHSVLEDGAWLGPGVIVTNARYPNRPDTKDNLEGVRVSRAAVVGAGAVLLPGVTIGAGAMVGGGAVVTSNVDAGVTVAGNPAVPL